MKKIVLSIFITLCGVINSNAQTMTGTVTTVPCNHNGVYSVTVSGLTAPISYTYYLGGGSAVIHSNVNSLTDQLTGFAAGGYGYIYCSASDGVNFASVSAYYTMPFYVSTSSTNPICPNTTGTLSASSFSGTPGPFTYNWTNTTTLANYSGNNIPVPIGQYSLSVTDQMTGCVVEVGDTASYISQTSNINLTYSTTPANCTNGTASVTATGGVLPYTYQWNTGANATSITNLTQGMYTATVTDAQGCISNNNWNGAYVQQSININVNPSVTNATCVQNNGSAIAFGSGGMPPYTYLWSNGQNSQTLTAVSGGTYYTVIATDANGCTGTGYASVGATTPINVTFTASPSSCTAPTGSASLTIIGGTMPYTTVWNTFSGTTTNTSISGVTAGIYSFTVADAVGCVRSGMVNILPVSTINVSIIASAVVCPATTGTVIANASGTNPPFLYNWSNGSTAAQISNVTLGGYSCVITDAVGCSVTRSANLYATSPIHVGLTPTSATCKFNSDGSVVANATGGTAPYFYSWSNGQSGATASGLSYGNIWVSVTDANGCRGNDHTYVSYNPTNNSCYCTITGKVYADANSNCTIDGVETGIHNIMIHCSGVGYSFTDANGNYSFQVPSGTYTLTESVNTSYPLALCQSNAQVQTVTASSGCTTTVNFANNVVPIHDLHIITTSNIPPIPGNAYYQKVIIENNGTLQESAVQIGYVNDGQLGSFTQNPNLFTQIDAINFPNHYSVQSGFTSLAPGTADQINLTYNTPTNIPLGTLVNFYDSTAHMAPINTTWLTDYTPWNNVQNYQQTVVSSFDPNFKEVSPKGTGTQGYIASKDSLLSYVIHFQNEGTYFAQNISVVDTLDADLDWTTLHPGYSDHNYTTTVSENGVITFKFANINLPWKSQYGDLMSSGLVTYTIKRKRNVAQGTQFKNTAAIYFDYNEPVITNTTVNTLNDLLSSVEEKALLDNSDVVLYPNPASHNLSIAINSKENSKGQVNILDISGKVISSQNITLETGKNVMSQNTTELPSGIYFVQVKCNSSFITKKLVGFVVIKRL
ncbi:MAG: T9SS type A sorting domain-containing protein [Bacteroidota bacterium]